MAIEATCFWPNGQRREVLAYRVKIGDDVLTCGHNSIREVLSRPGGAKEGKGE